ncbi:tryptophan 2,3-dioxygenase [Pseudoroseomonas cervicalis]|uniref:tryptophan 2,3-dioxygenase n=1 Tax=Teichococcus cervicalis TaxID=204525 RepID=UPI0022F15BD4|nr:tryptophan 2,3-dioxygenase [Pseudoroseomonas cervicalis]WBV44124.1 tryptophan 2,3-dioxygenase [Pseudoroseomonas cervicalis]
MANESRDGIETDFRRRMSYGDYLGLERLLAAQAPLSGQHDEMLFIIIHQVQELWMKLMNHELDLAVDRLRADDPGPAFKAMARVSRIQRQMVEAWDVLTTMTPADYLAFRDSLGAASGFQSWQYRLLEFRLGAKDAFMLRPHAHRPEVMAVLQPAHDSPSLYDEALRLLARRGLPVPRAVLERDVTQPYEENEGVIAAWRQIYRDSAGLFDLYELAEELVDLEDAFRTWRFKHMSTVERIIGHRPGTGGSAGVGYLKAALERKFFPELWSVRTLL